MCFGFLVNNDDGAQAEREMEKEVSERTYGDTVCVFLSDTLGFGLALLERMLVLELGAHFRFGTVMS